MHVKRSTAFMLLELIIANVLFVIMITAIMGWQCMIVTAFAQLKERVVLLRSVADCGVRMVEKKPAVSDGHCESSPCVLHVAPEGQCDIQRVLGVVPDYPWHYMRVVVSSKWAQASQPIVSIT